MQSKIKLPKRVTNKLRWGVAGCGRYLENSFLPTFQQLKRSKLVSVYSHDLNRAKTITSQFAAENAYNDFDKFLHSKFDILYIGSANWHHYEQVIQAAKAGKHIHCDKPLALNSHQAKEMVKVCRENNVYLSLNYIHRFHPLCVKAKDFIEQGMIGQIVSINTSFNIDLAPSNNFRFQKKKSGGGALRDLGTHMIDVLRFFGGTIIGIKGYYDNVIYTSEVDDFANGLVKFKKSGYGYFNVSFNSQKPINRIEILGHNGNLIIENIIAKKGVPGKLIIDLKGEKKKAFRKRANTLLQALRSLQKSHLKKEEPQVTGEDGLVNLQLMEELEKKCR